MKNIRLEYIKKKFKDNFDVKYREIQHKNGLITLVFIDNMTDKKLISEFIIAPLILMKETVRNIESIKKEVLYASIVDDITNMDEALIHIMSGDVVIIFDFLDCALSCEAKQLSKRSVQRPETEPAIKGPQEGFVELMNDNLSMLRKWIKTPAFKLEKFVIGKNSNTNVALAYLEDIAPSELVNFVRSKIKNLELDFSLGITYIEEEIKYRNTVFDTVSYTEKPDVVASRLYEGRIAVFVEGTPFILTAPCFFTEYFQSPGDYYANKHLANILRMVRLVSFFITVLLPGMYVAMITNHFSLVPTSFVFRFASSRTGVPFPTVIEVSVMLFLFELSREAGQRLPSKIGQPLSIVATLILGESAMGAGLASEATIVVVGIYAITSFINPIIAGSTSLLSLFIIIVSAAFGLHGLYIGAVLILSHIASLDSCGYPYLFPFGTVDELKYKYKDYLFRDDLKGISTNILKGSKSK